MKKVIYNGGRESYYGCFNPDILTVGKTYIVISEDVREFQTNYKLKGVKGEFNSVWFKEVDTIPIYFAVSNKVPEEGKRCDCTKLELYENDAVTQACLTSIVLNVEVIGKNTYKAVTKNSIYLISVM